MNTDSLRIRKGYLAIVGSVGYSSNMEKGLSNTALSTLREGVGLDRAEFGARCEISTKQIYQLEEGYSTLGHVLALAILDQFRVEMMALDIELEDLLRTDLRASRRLRARARKRAAAAVRKSA